MPFSNLKIPVFPGVNDSPLAPNEVNNANADYLIEKFNNSIDTFNRAGDETGLELPESSFYIDSVNGNDLNSGISSSEPVKTVGAIAEYINRYRMSSGSLNIGLIGSFDELDLSQIKTARDIFVRSASSSTPVNINGSIFLPPNAVVTLFPIASNFTINVTEPFTSFYLNNSTLIIEDGANDFIINTNAATETQIDVIDGILQIRGEISIYNTASAGSPHIFKCQNSKLIIKPYGYISNYCTIDSVVPVYLAELDYLSELYYLIGRLPTYTNSPPEAIFNNLGNKIFFGTRIAVGLTDAEKSEILKGEYSVASINTDHNAALIKEQLESLVDDGRLDASAIKNLNEISAETLRDKLETLSLDNRLDASAIKNINYLQYYTSTITDFFQPNINNNVTIDVGDSQFLTEGNHVLIQDAGTYEVVSTPTATSIVIKNLGYGNNEAPGSQVPNGKTLTLTGRSGENIYTFSTSPFILPAINSSVDIVADSIELFTIGSVFLANSIDFFRVTAIDINTKTITATRLGYYTSVSSNTTIAANTKLVISGLKGETGQGVRTVTTADFAQPALLSSVDVSLEFTEQYLPNNIIYIDTGGFYKVMAIVDVTTITLQNLGYSLNAAEGTIISSDSPVVVTGEKGSSAFSITTADFTTPLYNTNVSIELDSTDWFLVGSILKISDGFFEVISIDSTAEITAKFLSYSSTGENTVISSLSKVVFSGERGSAGEQGPSGSNSYTNFSPFTVPNIGGTVVLLVDTSELFIEGSQVFLEGAGIYEVVSILDNTSLTIKNIGLEGNAVPTTTVSAGKMSYTGISFNGYFSSFVGTFTMPSMGSTATLESAEKPYWLNVNDMVYIPTIGYLIITDITNNIITVRNDYLSYNSLPTTTSTDGRYYFSFGTSIIDHIVLKTSANFTQPIINNNVSVSCYTTKWLTPGMIISGPSSGHYEVISIIDNTTVLLKNLGYNYNNEVIGGTVIPTGTEFLEVGARGLTAYTPTYSFLNATFTQPTINASVTIDINDSTWMVVGQGIAIEGGGPNYEIIAINSATNIEVRNLGYENVSESTLVAGSGTEIISPSGIRGKDSTSFVTVATNFTQPTANSNIQIVVNRTDTINPGIILSGPNSGYYEVVSIDSSTLVTVKNLDYPTNNTLLPSSVIIAPEVLTVSGSIGPTGYKSTYSLLQSNFVQPPVDSNVQITVLDTGWISINQYVYVEGGGTYQVISVDSGILLTVQNLGYENVAPASTITGTGVEKVSPAGRRGDDGSVSSTSYISLTHQGVNPPGTSSAINIFSKNDDKLYTIDSAGNEHEINQDLSIGNSLSDILSITNNSGTPGLNLGNSNSIYGFNSSLKLSSDGTNPSSLILKDELNTNSITIKSPNSSTLTSSYALQLPPNAGSNGYALTTNGSGVTSWTDISGGSLSSVTDNTTTVNNVTSLKFTSGATVTQNGSVAEILIADGGSGGIETVFTNTTTYNATANTLILVGTGTNTINLPTTPANGTKVSIADFDARFGTSALTVNPGSGDSIQGLPSLTLDSNNSSIQLAFWNNKWSFYGTEDFQDFQYVISPNNVGTLTVEVKTANFDAIIEYLYLVDTISGEITATLPLNPPDATKIAFSDFSRNFDINNLIINASGANTIDGSPSKVLSSTGTYELVFYSGAWTTITGNSNGTGVGTVSASTILAYSIL